jgi:hypothetical protein
MCYDYTNIKTPPFTPDQIHIGGVCNIRREIEYEDLDYKTNILMPARRHMVLVAKDVPGKPEYWRFYTVNLPPVPAIIS